MNCEKCGKKVNVLAENDNFQLVCKDCMVEHGSRE